MTSNDFQDSHEPEEILRLIKAAMEHVSYAVMITTAEMDPPGPNIVYVTPAFTRITGFEPQEIIGKTPRVLQGPNTDRAVLARLKEAMRQGSSVSCELINYRKDRREYVAAVAIDPVRNANGEVTHWVSVQQDVTERKRAEETLAQAERLAAIGAAMAGLSHESRNALQRMQASLEELALVVGNDHEATEYISAVQHAQHDLFLLYEEVREFAAPVRLEPQTCYLDIILHDAWTTLAIQREGRRIRFREQVGEADLQCQVDEFAMRQVFRNILENSLSACRDPVEIEVQFSEARVRDLPALRVAVRDNGPGLDAEQQRRIFDEFFTTKTHGTGLGMAIVKRLITAHGGQVEVGTDYQAGAEIVMTLPRFIE